MIAKFPINGQWINFICIVSCASLYIIFSLIEHYVFGNPDFNLNKMLHRGEYDTAKEHVEKSNVGWLSRKLGITKEFTIGDKIIYFSSLLWTQMWFFIFIWFSVQTLICGVPDSQWMNLWRFKIYVTLILGISCTFWFLIGGIVDVTRLFKALKNSEQNDADNGSVVDGKIAGDK